MHMGRAGMPAPQEGLLHKRVNCVVGLQTGFFGLFISEFLPARDSAIN